MPPLLESEPPPEQDLTIPVASVADSNQPVTGVLESTVTDASISRGSGTGTGAGTGRGSGIGEGRGSGLGEGDVAGMGGGVYRPGSGIELPRVIREVKPRTLLGLTSRITFHSSRIRVY